MQNLILHAWQPITNLKKHYVSDARVELNDEGLLFTCAILMETRC